ncbi:MAG: Vms1/Ankzf1 family peptidyl-tRNA hydrolase [Candidatus Nanohaloarchaea archaeon]
MNWPWGDDEEKEQLRERVKKLEEELESWKERYSAESERRKELSREKQESEEELNRLRDRLRTLEEKEEEENEEEKFSSEEIGFEEAVRMIKKLGSIESPEEDIVTVYRKGSMDNIGDLQGLKNSVTPDQLEFVKRSTGIYFLDRHLPAAALKTRPFYTADWTLGKGFDTEQLEDFLEKQKIWVLVSAGDTKIYREESGKVEELEHLKSRVEHSHTQGGFSQSRFERKREEQVKAHLEEVEAALEGFEGPVLLLGEKRLCKELPGEHLGGFDPNKPVPEKLYGFRVMTR